MTYEIYTMNYGKLETTTKEGAKAVRLYVGYLLRSAREQKNKTLSGYVIKIYKDGTKAYIAKFDTWKNYKLQKLTKRKD
jgi:hypothetical protein